MPFCTSVSVSIIRICLFGFVSNFGFRASDFTRSFCADLLRSLRPAAPSPPDGGNEALELVAAYWTATRVAHDVIRLGHYLHDLETVRPEVPVAAEIFIAEAQQVTKLVRQQMRP